MWITPYHRNFMPEGLDNSSFGVPCEYGSLINQSLPSDVRIKTETSGPEHFPASRLFNDQNSSRKNVYGLCEATFKRAVCEPISTTLFLPDHACLLGEGDQSAILEESTWHSEIFFSEWFRCDRSTNWKYQVDRSFQAIEFDEPVANVHHRYNFQYFHWFMDGLPRVWYIKKLLEETNQKNVKWFGRYAGGKFQRESLSLFDLSDEDFIKIEDDRVVTFKNAYNAAFQFEESIGTLRPDYNSGIYKIGWSKDYLSELRDRAHLKTRELPDLGLGEKIYVTRPDASHRRMRNEPAVRDMMDKFGYKEFCPGQHSLYEQICVFKRAKVIIGTHGAGLANIVWSNPGTVVAEFMPDGLDDVGYRFTANINDMRHYVLKCQVAEHPMGIPFADIEVDIAALEDMLNEIAS